MIIVVDDYEHNDAVKALETNNVGFTVYSSIVDAYIDTELEDIVCIHKEFQPYTDAYMHKLTNAIKDDNMLVEHLNDTLEKESIKWILECNNYGITEEE